MLFLGYLQQGEGFSWFCNPLFRFYCAAGSSSYIGKPWINYDNVILLRSSCLIIRSDVLKSICFRSVRVNVVFPLFGGFVHGITFIPFDYEPMRGRHLKFPTEKQTNHKALKSLKKNESRLMPYCVDNNVRLLHCHLSNGCPSLSNSVFLSTLWISENDAHLKIMGLSYSLSPHIKSNRSVKSSSTGEAYQNNMD